LSATYGALIMSSLLSQNEIKELLSYDELTGIFKWSKKRRGIKVNVALGTDNGFGYLRITVLGKQYYAHRLAWLYVYGKWPKYEIDHINGNRSDNRIKNLRDITQISNCQNRNSHQSNSESKIMGVSWHKKAKKWQAHICIYKERKYLGLFNSIDEAHKKYIEEKGKINYECL
jgi:hypothetical protein